MSEVTPMSATRKTVNIDTYEREEIAGNSIRVEGSREWTGIDPQDADQFAAAGIEPNTPEWEKAAKEAYIEAIECAGRKISIFRDGVWAGSGRIVRGKIEDCAAVLGDDQDASDETYEAIEDAIEEEEDGDGDSVTRPDGKYSWEIA